MFFIYFFLTLLVWDRVHDNKIKVKIQNKHNPVLFSSERANNMYTASVITEKQLIKKALSACRNRQLRISKRLKTSFSNWFSSAKNSLGRIRMIELFCFRDLIRFVLRAIVFFFADWADSAELKRKTDLWCSNYLSTFLKTGKMTNFLKI